MKRKEGSILELRKQIDAMEIQQEIQAAILREQFNRTFDSLKPVKPTTVERREADHHSSLRMVAGNLLAGLSVGLFARKLFGIFYQRARA
jgi:hypothetical protein